MEQIAVMISQSMTVEDSTTNLVLHHFHQPTKHIDYTKFVGQDTSQEACDVATLNEAVVSNLKLKVLRELNACNPTRPRLCISLCVNRQISRGRCLSLCRK